MSYNQQNPRQAGQHRQRPRSPENNSQGFGNYDTGYGANSYETSSYDAPSYEPSTYETQRLWEENRDYRQGEGYRNQQNFRGNRDYRTTQEDYRLQQDYEIGDASERGDVFERSGREPWGLQHNQPHQQQDWNQYPQQSTQASGGYGGASSYRSAQFAGRQQIPGSQTTHGQRPQPYYGSDFGNARRQFAGDEAGRGQRWGNNPYAPQQSQFGWDEGSYGQPQGAGPGWQNNPSRQSADYYAPDRSQDYRGRAPKGYERSDDRIREDICERLTHEQRVDASEISVSVKAGVVTLEGSVGDRNQKYRVEDISDNVSGVKDVQNRLNVARSSGDQGRTYASRTEQQDKSDDLGKASGQKITRQ